MTLIIKTSRSVKYLYIQAGMNSLYIAPKNNPARSKMENMIKAFDYTRERTSQYGKSFDELLKFLPAKERKQYGR